MLTTYQFKSQKFRKNENNCPISLCNSPKHGDRLAILAPKAQVLALSCCILRRSPHKPSGQPRTEIVPRHLSVQPRQYRRADCAAPSLVPAGGPRGGASIPPLPSAAAAAALRHHSLSRRGNLRGPSAAFAPPRSTRRALTGCRRPLAPPPAPASQSRRAMWLHALGALPPPAPGAAARSTRGDLRLAAPRRPMAGRHLRATGRFRAPWRRRFPAAAPAGRFRARWRRCPAAAAAAGGRRGRRGAREIRAPRAGGPRDDC